jgi:putative inorganic carbon (HCO3(-)) transporter
MRDLLFLSVMLTMLPLTLRFPMVGVMGWAWTALLAPNDWLYSYMAVVPFNKLFAGATMIAMVIHARQLRLRMNTTLWLVLILLVLGTMSALLAIDQSEYSWALYWKFTKIILFAFVIAAVVRNRLDIHALLLAVALGVGFVGVSEGAFYLASRGGHIIRGNPSVGDNNSLAVGLLMVVPIILYLAAQAEARVVQLIGYAAAALVVAAVVGTFSRGALIGLVALLLFLLAGSRRKLIGFAVIVVLVVTIFVSAPESWFERMDTISAAAQDTSFMGRVIAWKISTMIALDHPLLGGGFHAVQHPFAWGYYGGNMGILDFVATSAPDASPHAAHSIFFEVLGDLGFPALFAFLGMIGSIYFNARHVRRLSVNRPDLRWAYDLGYSLQASAVVFVVSGSAVSISYSDLFYILLVITASLRELVVAETRPGRAMVFGRPPLQVESAGLRQVGRPALR